MSEEVRERQWTSTDECIRTKPIERVKIGNSRLGRVATCIMCERFLQAQLVQDSFTLVLDVVQCHASVTSEADVEREVHPSSSGQISPLKRVLLWVSYHSTYLASWSTEYLAGPGMTPCGGGRASMGNASPFRSVPDQSPATLAGSFSNPGE